MLCTKTLLQKQGNMIEMLISNQCAEKEMYRMPLLQIRKLHQYTERQLKPLLIVTRLIKRKIIKTCNWVSHETQSSHCLLKFCIFWKPISNNATEASIQHFKWLGFTMQPKQIRTAPANMGGHFTTRNANTHDLQFSLDFCRWQWCWKI